MINNSEESTFSFILAPMLDVIIFLLIFFMIAYAQSRHLFFGQNIKLPTTQTSKKQEITNFTVIEINKNGQIFLNKKPILMDKLKKSLTNIKDKSKHIFIRADKNLAYGKIMTILDFVKQAGLHKVYLLSLKNKN